MRMIMRMMMAIRMARLYELNASYRSDNAGPRSAMRIRPTNHSFCFFFLSMARSLGLRIALQNQLQYRLLSVFGVSPRLGAHGPTYADPLHCYLQQSIPYSLDK